MEKWSKEIWIGKIGILLTNFLRLGLSIRKTPYNYFHINLYSCQITIKIKGYE